MSACCGIRNRFLTPSALLLKIRRPSMSVQFAAVLPVLMSLATQPAATQTYIANPSDALGGGACPQGSSFALRTIETGGVYNLAARTLCFQIISFTTGGTFQIIQQQGAALAAQDQKIKELALEKDLLEKNLKTLSDAVDALTARLNKGEGK